MNINIDIQFEEQYAVHDISYIIELYECQKETVRKALSDTSYDLHDIGQLVAKLYSSKTLTNEWENNEAYHYRTELYQDTDLINKALIEVLDSL